MIFDAFVLTETCNAVHFTSEKFSVHFWTKIRKKNSSDEYILNSDKPIYCPIPELGSGLGPVPDMTPGARVGTGYVGLGETPGAMVGWKNGAGVGTLGQLGTSQHGSFGSTTILQPSGRLLKEGHLQKKKKKIQNS